VTLQFYLARRFAWTFATVLGIFGGLIFLTDMVEQVRRYDRVSITLGEAAGLAALNAPQTLHLILPLLMIIATVTLFLRLARTSELVVIRAAGRSAIRSLGAPVLVAFLIGLTVTVALNPIIAATTERYNQIVSELLYGAASTLSLGPEGLWLRQAAEGGQVVIHATGAASEGSKLDDVTFLFFADAGTPTARIEAAAATQTPGEWQLSDLKRWTIDPGRNPETTAEVLPRLALPTDLTPDQLLEGVARPETIAIWDLPAFIQKLETAGFSARAYRVWFHMELASPLFLAAMVLIGAGFTMRHTRFGKTGLMVLLAVLIGFGMFFMKSFAQILGDTGKIPVLLAAWAPPVAGILLSLGLLLHTEDG
jgi:lipopolysaccharide export system permease protein